MLKLNLDNLSINTVLVLGAVAGGIYLLWQAKNAASNVINFVKDADLNPFDADGFFALVSKPATKENPRIAGYDTSHIEAMRKIGLDIKKYHVWQPSPLMPLAAYPPGTIRVVWGVNKEKFTLYAPNANGANFQIFTL